MRFFMPFPGLCQCFSQACKVLAVTFSFLSALFDCHSQFEPTDSDATANGFGWQRGNAGGFVAIRVFETAGGERIVAQILDQSRMVLPTHVHFVTFPNAKCSFANSQFASDFR